MFSEFFSAFLKSTLTFEQFQKKMTLIADVFSKVRTPKNVVKQTSKKSRFRGPLEKQHGKGYRTMLKPEQHQLYHIYWLLLRKLSSKMSLIVIWKILGLSFKTLNGGHKYFLGHGENLKKPIQTQLSEKQTLFSELVSEFLKFTLDL